MWTCAKCGQKIEDAYEMCWACGTTIDGVENPDFLKEGGEAEPGPEQSELTGVPERLVTVARCGMPVEAYAMRLRLESAGIPVFLADEFTVTMDWLLSNAIGGIKVQVPEEDLNHANRILDELERSRPPEPAEDEEPFHDEAE